MKFLAAFVAILAVSAALPARATVSLAEVTALLENPNTNPALIPYLEAALNEIMAALWAGQQVDAVAIPLPAEIFPSPAAVEEAVITPTPVVVADAPAAASSPLVQIIVNVNQQSAEAAVPVPSPAAVPEIVPTPVVVVDETIVPSPVVVVDQPIVPTPVVVIEEPSAEIPVNPIDVIEVQPAPAPVEVNPIDVVAVGAPDHNPVDIMNPIPVNPAAEVGAIWV